jgi:hypothetical protein
LNHVTTAFVLLVKRLLQGGNVETKGLRRGTGTRTLTVAAAALAALVLATPSAVAGTSKQFTGGGRGPTAEVAVQAAIWDAEASAGSEALFNCTLVGEPTVFPSPTVIRAEATIECS